MGWMTVVVVVVVLDVYSMSVHIVLTEMGSILEMVKVL